MTLNEETFNYKAAIYDRHTHDDGGATTYKKGFNTKNDVERRKL